MHEITFFPLLTGLTRSGTFHGVQLVTSSSFQQSDLLIKLTFFEMGMGVGKTTGWDSLLVMTPKPEGKDAET